MRELVLAGKGLTDLVSSILAGRPDHRVRMNCRGHSMAPFIRDNDTVILKPVDQHHGIRFGDIVAVTVGNKQKFIIHRVIRLKNGFFQTKGDNNKTADTWCPSSDIIAIVDGIGGHSRLPYQYARWQKVIIAFASKTGILNRVLLPIYSYFRGLSR